MKRRLALLLSGLALAACSEPEPSENEQSASLAQPLPGDPICKWLPATATQLPTAPARRFTGLASSRTGASLAAGDLNGDGIPELVIGAPGISTTTTLKGYAHVVPLVPPATPPQTNLLDIRFYSTRLPGRRGTLRGHPSGGDRQQLRRVEGG
ncbi:FG-GAP repeat protein [Myxococcus stipitatus]|uniref:FG-GAP repeat protein n=1 Tax=Myxococcus stipitatus TaxID=83455 RepID=UPI0030CDB526